MAKRHLGAGHGARSSYPSYFRTTSNQAPVWSPDGKWIAFTSDRNGHSELRRKSADGSGQEELLLTDDQLTTPTDWSRDGKYLIFNRGPIGGAEIWALPIEGDRKPFVLIPHAAKCGGHLWGAFSRRTVAHLHVNGIRYC